MYISVVTYVMDARVYIVQVIFTMHFYAYKGLRDLYICTC